MTNIIGKTYGRYQVTETLGEGGMAAVYKGYDPRLGRDVAIKVILRGFENRAMFIKRFEREAKAVAQLTHPNIVGVIDYGTEDDTPYLVMEYIPGGTLGSRLGKPIPWDKAVQMLLPVARALDYAHSKNIIHRDIKPANLLVTTTGDLILSDFGIAKTLDVEGATKLTGTGMGVGTPAYMAPEQGMGEDIDRRVDVYSLGIVLYEMVTGRQPYEAPTPMAIMLKHLNEPLPNPRQYVPDLPEAAVQMLYKALAKDPAQRHQRMSDFALAMEDLSRNAITQPDRLPASGQDKTLKTPQRLAPLGKIRNTRGQVEASLPTKRQSLEELPAASSKRINKPLTARLAVLAKTLPRWARIGGGALALVLILASAIWGGRRLDAFIRATETPFTATQAAQIPAETVPLTTKSTETQRPSPIITDTPTPLFSPTPTGFPLLISDDYGVPMAWVPAGSFEIGSEDGDNDEKPVHTVALDDFYIDQYEVTNARYAACVNAGVCDPPSQNSSYTRYPYYGNPAYDYYPVIYISWYDAQTYCVWRKSRLPTEAEWEKAARGGLEGKTYPWGNDAPVCEFDAANGAKFDDDGSCNDTDTEKVGSYSANGYGLYDMAGNVWEWVADWYDVYPGGDPGASDSFGITNRGLRGGAWSSYSMNIRAGDRFGVYPGDAGNLFGFRCARSP